LLKEGKEESSGNSFFYVEKLKNISNIEEIYSDDGFWNDKYNADREKARISFD
jgi:hypothetical protein